MERNKVFEIQIEFKGTPIFFSSDEIRILIQPLIGSCKITWAYANAKDLSCLVAQVL